MTTRSAAEATNSQGTPRIPPSVPAALALILVYSIVFVTVAATSGIPYADWFATGSSAFRTAVLPLMVGAVLIVVFLWWARWDFVFRDPERLAVPRFYWIAAALFAVAFLLHLVFVRWGRLTPGLVLAVLAAGVLVGFCEETLFRGILLRSLRDGARSEAFGLVVTSVLFGLFHLTNLVTGSPVQTVASQVGLAATTGAILYAFRRIPGLLVVGMAAHGLWDISLFLPGGGGGTVGALVSLALLVIVPMAGVGVVVVSLVKDRETVVQAGELGGRRVKTP